MTTIPIAELRRLLEPGHIWWGIPIPMPDDLETIFRVFPQLLTLAETAERLEKAIRRHREDQPGAGLLVSGNDLELYAALQEGPNDD